MTPAGDHTGNPTGTTHWTSPTGRRYRKSLEQLPIDHTRPKIKDDPAPF